MAIYYVYQGKSYAIEKAGGYIWSPQRTKDGKKNAGFTAMTEIRKGDFILHHAYGYIQAISVTTSDCMEYSQLEELKKVGNWNHEGYRVTTDYMELDPPFELAEIRDWLNNHYIDGSAFTETGQGKQQYMCHLADVHAIYLLQNVIATQTKPEILRYLQNALSEIVGDNESEYEPVEMETIHELVENAASSPSTTPAWTGVPEKQAVTVSLNTGHEIPKRDPKRAAAALAYADYRCEYDPNDRTFLRKSGTRYTEPHHLIPISKYRDFDYSLDVPANIVSLCSHCHNLLHYGCFEDKKPILEKLYHERKDALQNCGIVLTLQDLESYYQ